MAEQKQISVRAWVELAVLSTIWGASFLSVRVALDEIPPLSSVAWRVAPAAALVWLYILVRGFALPSSPATWAALLVMGALNNAIPFTLMAWGQLHIESGLTSILNAATAIFGALAAAAAFADERITLRKGIGVGLGFIGVATAIGLDNLTRFDPRSLAQLAVIGGACSYALAGVWARKMLGGLSAQVATAGMLSGASVVMIPAALWIDGLQMPGHALTWAAIGYYAIPGTAVAYLLYYSVLTRAGAGNVMLCTLMVAPVAIVLGALFLGETIAPRAYAGFGLLAVGLVVLDGRLPGVIGRARAARDHKGAGPS